MDHAYLVHAANVLLELLTAARNLQDNWTRNPPQPMAGSVRPSRWPTTSSFHGTPGADKYGDRDNNSRPANSLTSITIRK
jgi:hypothetical protein